MNNYPIAIILALGFLKSLEFIYIWQIKEYRFDRFFSYLKEAGLLRVLYLTQPHKAAISLRNLLISLLNALLFIVLGIVTVQTKQSIVFTIILIILAPFLGIIVTSITVYATSLLSYLKREIVIAQATEKIRHSKAVFIGITGSYGKTTTKELLYNLISPHYHVEKTHGTVNTDIGIAMAVNRQLKENTEYFIVEIGAYKKGEIAKAAKLIPLSYAILTAIGNQHLDLFGSHENLLNAKLELFSALKPSGKAYVSKDIKDYQTISSRFKNLRSFSTHHKAEIHAIHISQDGSGLHADVIYGNRQIHISCKLLGIHNLSNLLPAIGVAVDLGIGERDIERAIRALKPVQNKLSPHKGINNSLVISDAGNSNVEGFIGAIKTIVDFRQTKKIILSKGIIELGIEKKSSYLRILKELEKTDIMLFTTDKVFKNLSNRAHVFLYKDEKEIATKVQKEASSETLILIEGKFTPGFIKNLII